MPLSTGQILNNRYRIVKLLSTGGFGIVYRVWDTNLDCPRALKENLDSSPEAQRQFKREAQMLTLISHPNLPKVIDHFIVPGQGQYLVMDFVQGQDLKEMIEEWGGPLPESQVILWIDQICAALEYLHAQHPPLIHRDIKPSNIRITPDGLAFLVDFGIAKIYDASLKTTLGARAVTPGFSPPEQYGSGITDAQSDIYALGATLYTVLCGQEPPASVDIVANNDLQPVPLHQRNPDVSPYISAAVERAMQPERQKRFVSIAEFRKALQPSQFHVSLPVSQTVSISTRAAQSLALPIKHTTRNLKKTAGVVLAVLALVVLFSVGVWWGTNNTSQAMLQTDTQTTVTMLALNTEITKILATTSQPSMTHPSNTPKPTNIPVSPFNTLPPSNTPTLTRLSFPVVVLDSESAWIGFLRYKAGDMPCYFDHLDCWIMGSSSVWGATSASSWSGNSVYIDPQWPNPTLSLWQRYVADQAYIEISVLSAQMEDVQHYTGYKYWHEELFDLNNYKGKTIWISLYVRFAMGENKTFYWAIQNVRIIPDYAP